VKEGWGFSWINVRYPDGRLLNIQWLERGATAPGELPGESTHCVQACLHTATSFYANMIYDTNVYFWDVLWK